MAVGNLNIDKLTRELREMFPEDKFRQFIDGDWPPPQENIWANLENVEMPDNVLGTARAVVLGAAKVARMKAMKDGLDHVEVEYEFSTLLATGFNIHLAQEGKTIFMTIDEAEAGISIMMDKVLLKSDPERFCLRYYAAMIGTARKQLSDGTVGTPDELSGYRSEGWMSPEQVAVLVDLRAERG